MAFPMAPEPKSLLGYYRALAPTAGVRVSPLCLGAMNFGDAWSSFMGQCDRETSFGILDAYYEAGGNFIDTANNYQFEESETWVGEWMKARGNRDQIVLATKFTTGYPALTKDIKIRANYQGNHAKSLHLSVQDSLKKLQTDYIDLLWLHWWDFSTSIPELMQSLHREVMAGRVLYLGISDTPAWVVSKANQYARDHALTQFCTYQGLWNASIRDFEREILPMVADEGMSLAPWGALGRGMFKTEEQLAKGGDGRKTADGQTARDKQVTAALDVIAKRKDTRVTSIALAYVRAKYSHVFPIIGGRNKEQLESNIAALHIKLNDAEIEEIEKAADFDLGFPLSFLTTSLGGKYHTEFTTGDIPLVKAAAHIESVPRFHKGPGRA